jgi:hypothetical protein
MTLDAKVLRVSTVTLMLVYLMVFSITSLSIMTLVNKTQAMKKLNTMTIIFTTLSLITPHKDTHPKVYAIIHYAECHYFEYRGTLKNYISRFGSISLSVLFIKTVLVF